MTHMNLSTCIYIGVCICMYMDTHIVHIRAGAKARDRKGANKMHACSKVSAGKGIEVFQGRGASMLEARRTGRDSWPFNFYHSRPTAIEKLGQRRKYK